MENPNVLKSAIDLEKISLTVKAFVASLIPIIHLLLGVEIVGEKADMLIDAVFLIITNATAIYGYFRAKNALQAQVKALGGNLAATGAIYNK